MMLLQVSGGRMEKGDATILHECSREITWATAPVGWGFKGILWICVDGVDFVVRSPDKRG